MSTPSSLTLTRSHQVTTSRASHSIYKIDRLTVPGEAIPAFAARLRRIQEALQTQPGCLQNLVLAGAISGDGGRDFVTVVEWESEAAFNAARLAIQQRYSTEGFDPTAFMQQLGVSANLGVFRCIESPA